MLQRSLTLQEAADALGVHYMTAYRYVRLGLLDATKVGSVWQVPEPEVSRLLAERGGDGDRRAGGRGAGSARWAARLETRLRAGDEQGAWGVVEAALSAGAEASVIHLDLLVPALRAIGDAWATGDIDVGTEHRASVIAMRLIGRLGPRFNRRGQTRGTVVLGAATGDAHGLPTALLSDLVRGAGFAVVDLGADPPVDSFVRAAQRAGRLVAVGVSVSTSGNERTVRSLTAALREGVPGVPVLVGGGAVTTREEALMLGADGWGPDGRAAVALLEDVVSKAS